MRKQGWKEKNPPSVVAILSLAFHAGRFFISLFKFLVD